MRWKIWLLNRYAADHTGAGLEASQTDPPTKSSRHGIELGDGKSAGHPNPDGAFGDLSPGARSDDVAGGRPGTRGGGDWVARGNRVAARLCCLLVDRVGVRFGRRVFCRPAASD